jgi:hypothetical protein
MRYGASHVSLEEPTEECGRLSEMPMILFVA